MVRPNQSAISQKKLNYITMEYTNICTPEEELLIQAVTKLPKTAVKTREAVSEKRTMYSHKVREDANPLKKSSNAKLGAKVLNKRWKYQPMYTLTLEERATCPTSCLHYHDCYGNNMYRTGRVLHGEDFEKNLLAQLEKLAAKHKDGFVVRLHILGDFYSVEYVNLWLKALEKYPNMSIYGYTHWHPNTDIGDAIAFGYFAMPDRFVIRFSDYVGDVNVLRANSINVVDKTPGRTFICPNLDGVQGVRNGRPKADSYAISCGECTLCWESKKTVIFPTH